MSDISQEDFKEMVAERTQLLDTIFSVAQALGFSVFRSKGGEEYHLPSCEDMVDAINKMESSEIRCMAVIGTTGCEVSRPREAALNKGWRVVASDWWCGGCIGRYGLEPDPSQPDS